MSLVKKIYQPQGIALPGGVLKIKSDKDRLWGQSPLSPVRPTMKTYTASLYIFGKCGSILLDAELEFQGWGLQSPTGCEKGRCGFMCVCMISSFDRHLSASDMLLVCFGVCAVPIWCLCAFAHQILIVWIFILCISSTVCLCTTLCWHACKCLRTAMNKCVSLVVQKQRAAFTSRSPSFNFSLLPFYSFFLIDVSL